MRNYCDKHSNIQQQKNQWKNSLRNNSNSENVNCLNSLQTTSRPRLGKSGVCGPQNASPMQGGLSPKMRAEWIAERKRRQQEQAEGAAKHSSQKKASHFLEPNEEQNCLVNKLEDLIEKIDSEGGKAFAEPKPAAGAKRRLTQTSFSVLNHVGALSRSAAESARAKELEIQNLRRINVEILDRNKALDRQLRALQRAPSDDLHRTFEGVRQHLVNCGIFFQNENQKKLAQSDRFADENNKVLRRLEAFVDRLADAQPPAKHADDASPELQARLQDIEQKYQDVLRSLQQYQAQQTDANLAELLQKKLAQAQRDLQLKHQQLERVQTENWLAQDLLDKLRKALLHYPQLFDPAAYKPPAPLSATTLQQDLEYTYIY